MWLHKAQSTTEYAITIGLVMALVAGVLQVALKGGIRQKNDQAINYMLNAGLGDASNTGFSNTGSATVDIYSQSFRKTNVDAANYADEYVMERGGSEKKLQKQTTTSASFEAEMIDKVN